MKITEYDRTKVFLEEIEALSGKLAVLCDQYQIPMFMTFAVKNDKDGTIYRSEVLSAAVEESVLMDDRIAKHVMVMNGFDVVPRISIPSYEEELDTTIHMPAFDFSSEED